MQADRRIAYLFVMPAFGLLILVLGLPAVAAVLQSLNLFWSSNPGFTTIHYARLFSDAQFQTALANTGAYVACVVSLHLVIGLAVAMLLNLDLKWKWFFRVVAILPWTIPDVIGGILWRFIFDTLPGFVNAVLLHAELVDLPVEWLGTPLLAFLSLVTAEVWRGYPFIMLILLAGLQSIPKHLYEAAAIDGATAWQGFIHVTLPSLKPMLIIALVLDVIWECRLFGMVFGMTGGGPGDATQVISVLTYKQYFEFYNNAYASAIAVALAAIMLVLSIPYLRISMKANT
jgi:multiple sugar transport system permease protein